MTSTNDSRRSTGARARTILGVILMSALLALYLVFAIYEAALLVFDGKPLSFVYGVALFVAPAIGIWSLVRELRFGRDAQRMFREYTAAHGEPRIPIIDRRDRDAVQALIDEPAPATWEAGLLRGLTLDSVGRRREGRAAVRRAISLRAGRA